MGSFYVIIIICCVYYEWSVCLPDLAFLILTNNINDKGSLKEYSKNQNETTTYKTWLLWEFDLLW